MRRLWQSGQGAQRVYAHWQTAERQRQGCHSAMGVMHAPFRAYAKDRGVLRNPGAIQRSRLSRDAVLTGCFLLLISLAASDAQVPSAITPDGTLGTIVTPDGRVFGITGGTRPDQGPNLFHSFGQFDVGTGDTAHFVGQPGVENIIGRVTGGSASLIDGRLQSDASLFLLNPSGLMFGPNATLDINGSFHASTADVLHFADGAAFSAHLNDKSTLTVANPSAFGFLGKTLAPITIQGSTLTVAENKAISVVGGDIQITGGKLVAPSGRIQIASAASPGEAMFSPLELAPEFQVDTFPRLGRLELSQGALLDVSGAEGSGGGGPGGTILIRSGHLWVDGSSMMANTQGDTDGASVGLDLRIEADAVIANDSDLRASPYAAGNGGKVTVRAGRLTLADGGRLLTSSFGAGHGGTLSVAARESITITGRGNRDLSSGLFSNAFGQGNGGAVLVSTPILAIAGGEIEATTVEGSRGHAGGADIRVGRLTLTKGADISSSTSGEGNAGNLEIQTGQLTLTEGAQISASTYGLGPGGTLTVIARESINIIDESGGQFRSGLFSNSGEGQGGKPTGDAGDIVIKAPQLRVDGGRILTRTLGDGNAGNITIDVDRLELLRGGQIFSGTGNSEGDRILGNPNGTGGGGHLTVRATEAVVISGEDRVGFSSGLFSSAQIGHGKAGDISISTPILRLDSDAQIATSTSDSGSGGTVDIVATETVSLDGSDIFANALGEDEGAGNAGTVVVEAPQVTLTGGAQIGSVTFGRGQGGNVAVRATETVSLDGTTPDGVFPSGIFANAEGQGEQAGAAGTVVVEARNVRTTGGAQIASVSFGAGRGGNVTVQATDMVTLIGTTPDGRFPSGIFASAEGTEAGAGNAGTVRVEADQVTLTDGAQINSSTLGPGHGGSVIVTAQGAVTLSGSDPVDGSVSAIFASARGTEAGAGNAGTVRVEADQVMVTGGALISSRTLGPGRGGSVTLIATEAITLRGTRPDGVIASGILANAEGTAVGAGNAGTILVKAATVTVAEGAAIASETFGPGNGGTVTVTATDTIAVSGPQSGLLTTASGSGSGGTIILHTGTLELTDGSSITAQSTGVGHAGTITIRAMDRFLMTDSTVTTEAPQADGGDVNVQARDIVRLRDSTITATVGGGPETSGGNITIDPDFVILENSQIVSNAFQGRGGNIAIEAGVFLADPSSEVSAKALDSEVGIDGEIDIRAPVTNLSGLVTPLPPDFASAASLLRDRCAAQLQKGTVSSLVARGRASVPATPEGLLPGRLYQPGQTSAFPLGIERQPGKTTVSQQSLDDLKHADTLFWQKDASSQSCQMLMRLPSP